MEYVPFPLLDLLDYDRWAKRPWTIHAIGCIFAQIAEAVAHVHENGIAHRDLKVENILVARDGTVKLIDFGSSAPSRNMVTGARLISWANWIGTPVTMAPEVNGETFYNMEKADLWSLAVIFLRLWLGVYPWEPQGVVGGLVENEAFLAFVEEKADKRPCMEGEHEDRLLCQIPGKARHVVAGMLETDPERRIGLRSVLESGWLREVVSTVS
ncbi:kinase-like protein [Lentithecium fluviatile CBS 122367]|uniref:non-specific serine/threonine protein kinase n=1 Tax=Lentithecium fluviatile CBS 122367 TaxID=1168545 RepID=A0A6G1IKK2_9PLEO|nr:kinase-like protein [Lentithecium fluviatile CBS 122367]